MWKVWFSLVPWFVLGLAAYYIACQLGTFLVGMGG